MKKMPGHTIILHRCIKNENHMMYGSWEMECARHNFLSFWAILYTFTLLTIQEITILKKMKKTLEDIKLKLCTTNDDHMIYGSWDVESNIHNFLLFWAIFCPFTPLTTRKIKILKKNKKTLYFIISHLCTTNENHMMYVSWDMESNRHDFLSIWTIICLFTP